MEKALTVKKTSFYYSAKYGDYLFQRFKLKETARISTVILLLEM